MTDPSPSAETPEPMPPPAEGVSSKRKRRRKRPKALSPNSVEATPHPKAYRPANEARHPVDSPRSYLRRAQEHPEKKPRQTDRGEPHWTPEGNGHVYRKGESVWGYRVRRAGSDDPNSQPPPGQTGDSPSEAAPHDQSHRRSKRRPAEAHERPRRRKKNNKGPRPRTPTDTAPPEST